MSNLIIEIHIHKGNMSSSSGSEKKSEFDFDLALLPDLYTFVEFLKNKRGNQNDWVQTCRWGLRGLEARLYGIKYNHLQLKDCAPDDWKILDSFIASILFHVDSAIECLVFALNALGNPLDSEKFFQVNNAKELTKIKPNNVICSKEKPFDAYTQNFPHFQEHCLINLDILKKVVEYHDASKHREMSRFGTMCKEIEDPVKGKVKKLDFVQLSPKPKAPHGEKNVANDEYEPVYLEDLLIGFNTFVRKGFRAIVQDIEVLKTALESEVGAAPTIPAPTEDT